jgi:hypothetical protein
MTTTIKATKPKQFKHLTMEEIVEILNDYNHPWFDDLLEWAQRFSKKDIDDE